MNDVKKINLIHSFQPVCIRDFKTYPNVSAIDGLFKQSQVVQTSDNQSVIDSVIIHSSCAGCTFHEPVHTRYWDMATQPFYHQWFRDTIKTVLRRFDDTCDIRSILEFIGIQRQHIACLLRQSSAESFGMLRNPSQPYRSQVHIISKYSKTLIKKDPIKGILKNKEINLSYFKVIEDEEYVKPYIYHSVLSEEDYSAIMDMLNEKMQSIVRGPSLTEKELLVSLGTIHWWLAHTMPFQRGSAAIAELFIQSLAAWKGYTSTEWMPELLPDMEAILSELDVFVTRYGDGEILALNGNSYSGLWENGKMHGEGTYRWPDGSYKGQWENNLPHGVGVLLDVNGDSYEGSWENGKAHGRHGTYRWLDGSSYEGSWENGKAHGRGIWRGSDGKTYDGEWENGKMHGHGTYCWFDGSSYEGCWDNGKMHGEGTYRCIDGRSYHGQWENNQQYGHGTYRYPDGTSYESLWENGKALGQGIYRFPVGKTNVVEWKNGHAYGNGQLIFVDGTIYEGQWKNGQAHGYGKSTRPKGRSYEGQWENGLRHGRGKDVWNEVCTYEGEWNQDQKDGQGKMTWPDGSSYEGEWKKDQQHGFGILKDMNGEILCQGMWEEDNFVGTSLAAQSSAQT